MDENKIEIRQIDYHSDEYILELHLRDEVLRKPLGMSLYNDNLENEWKDVHIGAFSKDKLIGVLILTPLNDQDIKMRQVAVDEKWRTKKIGSELVRFAENFLKSKGFKKIVLNSRKTAVGFYEKLGYEKVSDEFLEINIPHFKLQKRL